jgi:hypothetical protein
MGHDMYLWLAPGSDVWAASEGPSSGFINLFAERMLGFQDMRYKAFLVPVGPWPTEKRMKDVGVIGQHGWVEIWRSMYAPFQVFGMSAKEAQMVVDRSIAQLTAPDAEVSKV